MNNKVILKLTEEDKVIYFCKDPKLNKYVHRIARKLSARTWVYGTNIWLIEPSSSQEFLTKLIQEKIPFTAPDNVLALHDKWLNYLDQRLELKKHKKVPFELGRHFKGKLYDFQTVGSYYLYTCRKGILGDPVGTGKTPMSIAASLKALLNAKVEFVFITVPAHLRGKWGKDLQKFTDVKYINMAHVPNRIETYRTLLTTPYRNTLYMITSYASLTRDIKGLLNAMPRGIKYCAIFDEIQKCKHRESGRSEASYKLAKRAKHVYGLSATYTEGRLEELYDVFNVIWPLIFGTWAYFKKRHFILDPWGGVCAYKKGAVTKVKNEVLPFALRRNIGEIGVQMPQEVYQEYWIHLTETQKGLYKDVVETHLTQLKTEKGVDLTRFIRERQCCLSTELIDPETSESPKTELLKEIIASLEEDAKVVIFCYFVKMVDFLVRDLTPFVKKIDPKWKVISIHGQRKGVSKDQVKEEFEGDPNYKLLITSDVFKEGHDLPSARHIVNFDLLWNPAELEQRAGRLLRLTQKASHVVIHTLITKDTIEETHMWKRILEKREVMTEIREDKREDSRITRKSAIKILEAYRG